MEIVVEILLEILFEGAMAGAKSKKIPVPLRVTCIVLLAAAYLGAMAIVLFIAVTADSIIARIAMWATLALLLFMLVLLYRSRRKRKIEKSE